MRLFDDVPSARAALARGAPAFLLVNPIEYHGPHLSLLNDHHVSVGLARDLHGHLEASSGAGRGWPLLVTRDLDVGVEPTSGPGTVHVPYFEVRRRALEACRALHALGARRVVLLTFHGAPLHSHALDAAARWLEARGVRAVAPMSRLLRELVFASGEPYREAYAGVDPALREEMIRDLPSDFHGGFFEPSLALHYAPHTVRAFYKDVPPCAPFGLPALARRALARLEGAGAREASRELSLVLRGARWMALRPFPGYTGRPGLATAEAGAVFARELGRLFGPLVEDVLEGRAPPPRPPLGWLRLVTLFGVVGIRTPPSAVQRFEPQQGARPEAGGGARAAT